MKAKVEVFAYYCGKDPQGPMSERIQDNEQTEARDLFTQVIDSSTEQALALAPHDTKLQIGLSRGYSARVCLYNFPYAWTVRAQQLAEAAAKATEALQARAV